MHPRLDEIRKRLLTPPAPSGPPLYKAPARPPGVFSPVKDLGEEPPPTDPGDTATTKLNSISKPVRSANRMPTWN